MDNDSDCDVSSIKQSNKRNVIDDVKHLDSNYQKYRIPFNKIGSDGKFHRTILIENYGSGRSGTLIRNAVTGSQTDAYVGSFHQDMYFKVVDVCGRFNRREPLVLFYDSPEQYENHKFVTVDTQVKELWNKKMLAASKRLKLN